MRVVFFTITGDSVVVLNPMNRALPNPMLKDQDFRLCRVGDVGDRYVFYIKSRTLGRSMEEVGSSDHAGLLFPGVYFVTQPDFAKMHQHRSW